VASQTCDPTYRSCQCSQQAVQPRPGEVLGAGLCLSVFGGPGIGTFPIRNKGHWGVKYMELDRGNDHVEYSN
jgi:hypothetical protein